MTIDLHVHTTCSDGIRTPEQTVIEAAAKKIKIISITDHDITEGVDRALEKAKEFPLEIIPGVEINSIWVQEEIHILGYYIDTENIALQDMLTKIRKSRDERAQSIINILQKLAYNISIDEVKKFAGNGAIGRPHIARMLVRKGYFRNTDEVFKNLLSAGKKAFVDRYKITPREVIELINHANGIPVMAHPGIYSKEIDWGYFTSIGLQGIEVYHSKHDYKATRKFIDVANSYGLIKTGGSDCHGIGTSSILDSLNLPYEIAIELQTLNKMKNKKNSIINHTN